MQNLRPSLSKFLCWNFASAIRGAGALAAVLVGLSTGAQAGIKSPRQLSAIASHTPAPQIGGYLVQGINNDEADVEVVSEWNLIGVVVHSYASTDTAFRQRLIQRFATQVLPSKAATTKT